MIANHLNVFKVESYRVNLAGEKTGTIIKQFDNSVGDEKMQTEIKEFLQEQLGMNYIDRMKQELYELREKINKGMKFLEKEEQEPKFLDEEGRKRLEVQLKHMKNYYGALRLRIPD